MLRLNFILGLIFVFPLQVIFHTHSKDSLNQDTSNLYQGPCTIRHAWVQLYYPSKYFLKGFFPLSTTTFFIKSFQGRNRIFPTDYSPLFWNMVMQDNEFETCKENQHYKVKDKIEPQYYIYVFYIDSIQYLFNFR